MSLESKSYECTSIIKSNCNQYSVTLTYLEGYYVTDHLPWTIVTLTTYIKLKINHQHKIRRQKKHKSIDGMRNARQIIEEDLRKQTEFDNKKYKEARENIVPVGGQLNKLQTIEEEISEEDVKKIIDNRLPTIEEEISEKKAEDINEETYDTNDKQLSEVDYEPNAEERREGPRRQEPEK